MHLPTAQSYACLHNLAAVKTRLFTESSTPLMYLMLLAPIQLVQMDIAVACPSFLIIVSLAVPAKNKAFWP